MDQKKETGTNEECRIRCKGDCFQGPDKKRCEAYGHHEWCQNYMVKLSVGTPEYYEEAK